MRVTVAAQRAPRSVLAACLAPPHLPQPRGAAAAGAVEAVAQRVLLGEVLVVALGGVERAGGQDERGHLAELADDARLARFGGAALLVAVHEDGGAVLRPLVAELPLVVARVDVVPEDVEQLLVARLGRVVGHFDRLEVAGPVRRDLLVSGVLLVAAGVAGDDREHAGLPLERVLGAPEAAHGEGGDGALRRRRGTGGAGNRSCAREQRPEQKGGNRQPRHPGVRHDTRIRGAEAAGFTPPTR